MSTPYEIVLEAEAATHDDERPLLLNCGAGPAPGATAGSQTDAGSLTFRLVNPEQAGGGALTVLLLGPNGETVERPLAADGTVTVDGSPGDRWTLLEVHNQAGSLDKKKV